MATKTVLIVDDDPEVHVLLSNMLEATGWHIRSVFGGEQALSILAFGLPDVVLTDIVMPEMDGLTLLRRIREAYPRTKTVVMTAVNTPDNVFQSIREQAYSYIAKPVTQQVLIETLARAMTSEAAADDIVLVSAQPNWVSMEVRCRFSTAERLTQFFRELSADLRPEEREAISTAFRELVTHAIEHSGHSDPRQKLTLTYVRGARCVLYIIRDPGAGFSVRTLAHTAVSNPPDRPFEHMDVRKELGMRAGGFGILMSRNFVDEVIYNEKGNEVVLIKYLSD